MTILTKKLGTLLTSHQLPCEISHFIENIDNLGQQARQMHYLEQSIFTSPKAHDEIILFIFCCLEKLSKIETFGVF